MLTLGNEESSDITNARASEWDEIERKLNDNSFFSFCTPRDTWRQDDRMTVLLRYAGLTPTPEEQKDEVFPFLTKILNELKTKSRITIWKMIYSAFYRLLEWYNDPLMYHAFGAIVHQRNNKDIKPKTRKEILDTIEKWQNTSQKKTRTITPTGEKIYLIICCSAMSLSVGKDGPIAIALKCIAK